MQTLKVGVANIYRNTEENCQCTIVRPSEVLRDKLSEAGLCFGWDRENPDGLRLIGKFHHLKKVLEDNDISFADLISDIEIVPSKKSSSYGR